MAREIRLRAHLEYMKVLITGGAGFIGQHLAHRFIRDGYDVTLLDNLLPQIHGDHAGLPPTLATVTRFIKGDVADSAVWKPALEDQNIVVHLAAETGTGQSMYEVERYQNTNLGGTAKLLQQLVNGNGKKVQRLVVASSRAIYGEGAYTCAGHGLVYPQARKRSDLLAGRFDPVCPVCQRGCEPTGVPETAPLQPSSFYGLTKQVQEQTFLMFGRVLQVPAVALRYQNVYGPGQSLRNPYTGILAVFSNLAREKKPIRVFEDGLESRDFVYIDDVVDATFRAATYPLTGTHSVNVGSGVRTTVAEIAREINTYFQNDAETGITGEFREGDIRHNCADLTLAAQLLGYAPGWHFHNGLKSFLDWTCQFEANSSGYDRSLAELRSRGLMNA